jgi:PAS domain S-box-containing protein
MELALPRAHRIARYNYVPRTASFAFAFLAFATLWIEQGRFNAWELFAAALTFLLYPHLAYLHARIAINSKRAELRNLYADCLLFGLWTAQIRFALWPSVGILAAICLNSAGHGNISRLLRSLAVFGAGAAAWGALTGYDFRPDTGPLTTAFCFFGILAYVSWVGALVFIQNKNLVRTQTARRNSEEQFRFIAENVRAMVSVLDTQGRFLYASSSYAKHFDQAHIDSGANWLVLVHPDDREQARSFLHDIAASAASKRIQLRLVSAEGAWRFVECQGNPVPGSSGKPKMIVLVSHDRSEFLESVK